MSKGARERSGCGEQRIFTSYLASFLYIFDELGTWLLKQGKKVRNNTKTIEWTNSGVMTCHSFIGTMGIIFAITFFIVVYTYDYLSFSHKFINFLRCITQESISCIIHSDISWTHGLIRPCALLDHEKVIVKKLVNWLGVGSNLYVKVVTVRTTNLGKFESKI